MPKPNGLRKNPFVSDVQEEVEVPIQTPFSSGPDAMDIDDTGISSTVQSTSPKVGIPRSITDPELHTSVGRAGTEAVNLNDLTQTAPFAPSSTGLRGMDDLATTLPFESRASRSANVRPITSSTPRDLKLPRPPKPIVPPGEDMMTNEKWKQYVRNMEVYMTGWNQFNTAMIDHFRARQDQIHQMMSKSWVDAIGDGPSADEIDSSDGFEKKAGYGAYMTWLQDDARCRTWWEHANEQHRKCLEDLGRIRERVRVGKA